MLRRTREEVDHALGAARLVARYLRSPADALAETDDDGRADLLVAGILALAVGAGLSVAVARARGVAWSSAAVYAEGLFAWALARLIVLRLAAPPARGQARIALRAAWGPALWPFALAVAAPLDLLALAGSAWLTLSGLEAIGMRRAAALRCVAWAFGGQVLVLVAASMARSGFFALLR